MNISWLPCLGSRQCPNGTLHFDGVSFWPFSSLIIPYLTLGSSLWPTFKRAKNPRTSEPNAHVQATPRQLDTVMKRIEKEICNLPQQGPTVICVLHLKSLKHFGRATWVLPFFLSSAKHLCEMSACHSSWSCLTISYYIQLSNTSPLAH